jgi:hypothetical protein
MMGSHLGWRLGSVYGDRLPQKLGFKQVSRSLPFHPTLAITWPQGALGEEDSLVEAAQVHGDVIRPPAASGFVLGCPSKP